MERKTTELFNAEVNLAQTRRNKFFRDRVVNYPTVAEAYKVAALNGLNKL
jgi:hypothetical protein